MKTKIHEYVYSEHENYITGKELLEMSGAKIWAETESETIYTMDDAMYIIERKMQNENKDNEKKRLLTNMAILSKFGTLTYM